MSDYEDDHDHPARRCACRDIAGDHCHYCAESIVNDSSDGMSWSHLGGAK